MQREVSPGDGGNTNSTNTTATSPLSSTHQPQLQSQSQHDDQNQFTSFTSTYPSHFPPKSSLPNSVSISPSDCSFDDDTNDAIATENRLYQARYVLEYQDLYNRYTMCLTHLHEAIKDVDDLRQDNADLRLANKDLTNRLSLLSQASIQNCLLSSGYPSLSFINDFHRLAVGTNVVRDSHVTEEVSDISPTSVIQSNRFERSNNDGRVSLPKSISVRSNGYLKASQPGPSRNTSRHRVTSPVTNASQRVYVPGGGKREEEALEFEVYNQGMLKTELCNKWQETGTCPYGDHCQFAHGITELRPVIRHPRYKTEVCRMVLSGDACPYGHRCHFRHTLTDQERLLGPR